MVNRLIRLSYLLAPGQCRLCGARSDRRRDLCRGCQTDLPWLQERCRRCALPLSTGTLCGRCLRSPPAFEHCIAAWCYQYPVDHLINAYKHRGTLASGHLLAELWCEHREEFGPLPDCLVPVPLHWRRLLRRGFNQADYLADLWGQALDIPVRRALKRNKATTSQQQLAASSRRRNLRGAFQLQPGFDLGGQHVALVDDVLTTGATAHAAAGILKRAGARRVDVWCLARTP